MIGGFTLFTLGDYFKDIPCIITNMSRDVKIDLYPWEINMRGEDLFEAPKMIDVRLSINILGHQTPSTQIKSFSIPYSDASTFPISSVSFLTILLTSI